MTLALISFVLFLGIVFIFLEVYVIPGFTFFGAMGFVLTGAGVYFAYKMLGTNYGHFSVLIGFAVFVILSFFGRNLMNGDQFSLKQELTSKVNELEVDIAVGDACTSLTELRPNGKAMYKNEKIEVYSTGEFVEKNVDLKVVKIEQNKIIVKPLNIN